MENKVHQELRDLFNKTEVLLKDHEHLDDFYTAPLNECRYALRHFVDSLNYPENSPEREDEEEKAKKHLKRAYYDSYEAITLYYQSWIMNLQGYYIKNMDIVQSMLPNYTESMKASMDINELRDKKETNRDEFYEKLSQHLPVLKNFRKEFLAVQPAIAAKIRKEENDVRQKYIELALIILGIIITIALSIAGLS